MLGCYILVCTNVCFCVVVARRCCLVNRLVWYAFVSHSCVKRFSLTVHADESRSRDRTQRHVTSCEFFFCLCFVYFFHVFGWNEKKFRFQFTNISMLKRVCVERGVFVYMHVCTCCVLLASLHYLCVCTDPTAMMNRRMKRFDKINTL